MSSSDQIGPEGGPLFPGAEIPSGAAPGSRCATPATRDDSATPGNFADLEVEPTASNRESDRDLDAEAMLRAIAHSPPRRPRGAVAPETPWSPSGRYIVKRRVGRGGMGTVYAAIDTVLDRVVALKVLDATAPGQDAAHYARMLREAQLAARMEHERIARVYDVGTHDGFAFVAMEYVPGGTLRQWMTGREVPVPQIVDVATQIAEGLAELHAKGVIHRDLKPENVMLTAQGGVKLLDFGLARNTVVHADEPGAPPRPAPVDGASVATASGTPGYMAPEQCAGQPIDARVDIFALGVIIHELVTGEKLFRGKTPAAIMKATLDDTPAMCESSWARVPERLREHTARMLARDAKDRFSDGGRVLAALRELTVEMSLHRSVLPPATAQAISKAATQLALPPQRPRFLRQLRARYLGRTLVVAAAVVVAVLRPWQSRESAEPGPVQPPPPGMARIDVGTITVGRNADELDRECAEIGSGCDRKQMQREVPATKVTVPAFFLDKTEVTNEDFAKLLNDLGGVLVVSEDEDNHYPRYVHRNRGTGESDVLFDLYPELSGIEYEANTDILHRFRVRANHDKLPVAQVSWHGAKLFCEMRGKRLPTEDEWEAAARGTHDRRYPWGNEAPRCGEVVVKNDGRTRMSGDCPRDQQISAQAVGTAAQDVTPDGIRDLAGNVAEWTSALFIEGSRTTYSDAGSRDAPRVIRGGSWAASLMARTTGRSSRAPLIMAQNLGFRCAADARNAQPAERARD